MSTLPERLHALLDDLADGDGHVTATSLELADHLGLTDEFRHHQVTRALGRLQEEGHLERTYDGSRKRTIVLL